MTSLVLSFGGTAREPVCFAFSSIVQGPALRIFLLSILEEEGVNYREFEGDLDQALALFASGNYGSVQVEGRDTRILGGIYRPRFGGQLLAEWSASIEGPDLNAEEAFEDLKAMNRLGYIALSKEDSIDFEAEEISEITFPWSHWRLVAGAVRVRGEWVVRRGECCL